MVNLERESAAPRQARKRIETPRAKVDVAGIARARAGRAMIQDAPEIRSIARR